MHFIHDGLISRAPGTPALIDAGAVPARRDAREQLASKAGVCHASPTVSWIFFEQKVMAQRNLALGEAQSSRTSDQKVGLAADRAAVGGGHARVIPGCLLLRLAAAAAPAGAAFMPEVGVSGLPDSSVAGEHPPRCRAGARCPGTERHPLLLPGGCHRGFCWSSPGIGRELSVP